jgi:hypothetical protein
MSITPVSNIPVSIDYTGRDYYSIRESLIARIQDRLPEWTASDPSDFGVALVEAFAYLGDMVSFYIDRMANESFIQTATQRDSILNIAQTYGYVPAGYRQASVDVTFTNSSNTDIVIPTGTVVKGDVVNADTVETVYFTTNVDAVVPAAVADVSGTDTVTASHGRSVTLVSDNSNVYGELIGTSNGTPEMTFELGETPVVDGSIEVYVQDGDVYSKWTQVQHIIDYGLTDLVYSSFLDQNGNVFITFGDGVSGVIPVKYSEVRARYVVGGGAIGNVAANSLDTIVYVPGLSEGQVTALQSSVTVINQSSGLGGSDPESNDQIRISAPSSLRSGNRAVTLKDFSDLSLSVSGVGKANATADVWTSVTVYISPSRTAEDTDSAPGLDENGDPTPEYLRLKTNVEEFLKNKVLIGTSVTIQPPTYVDAVLNLQYAKLEQYTTSELETNIKNALLSGFGYNGMKFEDTIYPQDVEFVLQQTPGILTVKVTALHEIGGSGLTTLTGGPGEIFRFKEDNISLSEI